MVSVKDIGLLSNQANLQPDNKTLDATKVKIIFFILF
jgi:hypothetical protein